MISYTYPVVAVVPPGYSNADAVRTATGATAGIPGAFTPANASVPRNLQEMTGVVANPATAWTTGQHVVTTDTSKVSWNGTAWAAGPAAAAADKSQQIEPPPS